MLSAVAELGFLTFWRDAFGHVASPLTQLACGILIGLSAWQLRKSESFAVHKRRPVISVVHGVIFAIAAVILGSLLQAIMLQFPVDPLQSDVIPSLELYVKRLLAGEKVYAPLEFPGWTVLPTYFPLLWAPYIFSELLQIDYRWSAYTLFLVSIAGFWIFGLSKRGQNPIEVGIKILLPFLFLYALTIHSKGALGHGVELTPVAYYFILVLTVNQKKPWMIGLGVLLCLLSRYAFTFWLPMYLLIIWMEYNFKMVFKAGLWVLGGVLALYVIPFLLPDPNIFFDGLSYYSATATSQWVPLPWQGDEETPFHLNRGLSVAWIFYEYAAGSIEEKLALNKLVHLGSCLLAVLIMFGYYWRNKISVRTNLKLYLIICLKVYLSIFYGLFYVPFNYLFMVPIFLTIPIIYRLRLASKVT